MLKPTATIPRMTTAQVVAYRKLQQLSEEVSALNARLRELEEQRGEAKLYMDTLFMSKGTDQMRISARRILMQKIVEVPAQVIERKKYSYSQWVEVQG